MLTLIENAHPEWWHDLMSSSDKDNIYDVYLRGYHWDLTDWWDAWIVNSL